MSNHTTTYNQQIIQHLLGSNLKEIHEWKPVAELINDFNVFKEFALDRLPEIINIINLSPDEDLEAKKQFNDLKTRYKEVFFDVSFYIRKNDIIANEALTATQLLLSMYYFQTSLIDDDIVKIFLNVLIDKEVVFN